MDSLSSTQKIILTAGAGLLIIYGILISTLGFKSFFDSEDGNKL